MASTLASEKQIPFGKLSAQHAELDSELSDAFERVLASSAFVLGEEVEAFEHEFASYCGVRHCVGVGSGTAALTLSLIAAGIGRGDEVIVPAHTFIASALAVVHAGATPVLCDVREEDGLIDPRHARDLVSERTAALMPVHLYGQLAHMSELRQIASRHGLLLLEDAAQAHGARLDGAPAGSLGDAAAFSFYPGKNLGALGDGGAICTDDAELADSARKLRDLGRSAHGLHEEVGFNERLDGLQAAFLRTKLPTLDRGNERRREHATEYRRLLAHARCLPERGASCVFHLFPIRATDRDGLRAALAEAGIQTGIHYSPAVHEQPAIRARLGDQELPQAARWAREELSLPIYPELEPNDLQLVAEEVNRNATPIH